MRSCWLSSRKRTYNWRNLRARSKSCSKRTKHSRAKSSRSLKKSKIGAKSTKTTLRTPINITKTLWITDRRSKPCKSRSRNTNYPLKSLKKRKRDLRANWKFSTKPSLRKQSRSWKSSTSKRSVSLTSRIRRWPRGLRTTRRPSPPRGSRTPRSCKM